MVDAKKGRPIFSTVAVGATDKVVLPANPRRLAVYFTNSDLASTIYLAVNQVAVIGKGIALGPVYDDIGFDANGWPGLPAAEWHAAALLTGTAQGAQVPWSATAFHASMAALGVVDSFTVPAGSSGLLQGASFNLHAGAGGTVQLQLLRGGNLFPLTQLTASGTYSVPVALQASDVVQWNVTVLSAGEDGDFVLSGYTVPLTGAAPTSVQLGVLELEG